MENLVFDTDPFEFIEPSCHSYLGNQLKDRKSRIDLSCLDTSAVYSALLVPLSGVVLFPGEVLPLRVTNPDLIRRIVDILLEIQQSNNVSSNSESYQLIGVVRIDEQSGANRVHGSRRGGDNNNRNGSRLSGLCSFGTIIEIRSSNVTNRENLPKELILTASGRLRFQLESVEQQQRVLIGSIRLLSERRTSRLTLRDETSPFPDWVYRINSPVALARQAYQLGAESSLATEVI